MKAIGVSARRGGVLVFTVHLFWQDLQPVCQLLQGPGG